LYEMFHTRNALHRRAYQHPVTKAVDLMYVAFTNINWLLSFSAMYFRNLHTDVLIFLRKDEWKT